MMSHPSDDDLMQHGSGDLPSAAHAEVDEHVRSCDSCRAVSDQIRDTLHLVRVTDVPEPGNGFEARMWARIAPQLEPRGRTWRPRQLVPLVAWAALVTAVIGATVATYRREPVPAAVVAEQSPEAQTQAPERVLLTALDEHFAQAELLLVELLNAPAGAPGALEFERAAAGDLVAAGRLYRETAEDTGQRQFAEIIDELEPVLLNVARSPESLGSRDIDAWREQIENAGLLFKVRVATNEIRVRRDPLAEASKGAL